MFVAYAYNKGSVETVQMHRHTIGFKIHECTVKRPLENRKNKALKDKW